MFENILLWGVLGYLICRILLMVFHVKPRLIIRVRPNENIEGMLLPQTLGLIKEMPEVSFIAFVKARFAQISTAFAAGQLDCVKNFVTPEVFKIFTDVVNQRKGLGQSVDFRLIDFKNVQTKDIKNNEKRWISFETEQINLLKDKSGRVIEGNEMYLSCVQEKWLFKWYEKKGWILSAIETVDSHAI